MTGRIIHVGSDELFRVPILEKAGYRVDVCTAIDTLHPAMIKEPAANAVAITDTFPDLSLKAVSIVRATATPLILFGTLEKFPSVDFDLTIPTLTPPADWIAEVDKLIEEFRSLGGRLKQACEESRVLQRKSALMREEVAIERNARLFRKQY